MSKNKKDFVQNPGTGRGYNYFLMCRYALSRTTFEKIACRTEARPWRPMTIGAFGEMEEQKVHT
ncbi:hypothetical protein QTP88_020705 [Uroleucon formosanum]